MKLESFSGILFPRRCEVRRGLIFIVNSSPKVTAYLKRFAPPLNTLFHSLNSDNLFLSSFTALPILYSQENNFILKNLLVFLIFILTAKPHCRHLHHPSLVSKDSQRHLPIPLALQLSALYSLCQLRF